VIGVSKNEEPENIIKHKHKYLEVNNFGDIGASYSITPA